MQGHKVAEGEKNADRMEKLPGRSLGKRSKRKRFYSEELSSICSIFFCCVVFDFLFGENWRKASTVLHLKFLPSKRKKARKCELFGHNIYFIAQVCIVTMK